METSNILDVTKATINNDETLSFTPQPLKEEEASNPFIPSEYTKQRSQAAEWSIANDLADYSEDDGVGYMEGAWIGLKTSTIGTAARKTYLTGTATNTQYIPQTEEERQEVLKVTGYSAAGYKAALTGAANMDEVRLNLERMQSDQQLLNKLNNSSWGVNLTGSIAGMLGDPIMVGSMFIPFAGGAVGGSRLAAFAGRAAFNVGTQVPLALASEYSKEYITGREGEYWAAAGMATAFGVGFASSAFFNRAASATDNLVANAKQVTLSPSEQLAEAQAKLKALDDQELALTKANQDLDKAVKPLQRTLDKANTKLDSAKNKLKAAEDGRQTLLNEQAAAKAELTAKTDEVAKLEAAHGKVDDLKKTISQESIALAKEQDMVKSLRADIAQNKAEKAALRDKIKNTTDKAKKKEYQKDLKEAVAKGKDLDAKLKSTNAAKTARTKTINNAKSAVKNLTKAQKELAKAKTKADTYSQKLIDQDYKINDAGKVVSKAKSEADDAGKAYQANRDSRAANEAEINNIQSTRLPLNDAINQLNQAANASTVAAHNNYLQARQQAGTSATVGNVSTGQIQAAQQAAANSTGNSLANTITSNPTLLQRFRNLLSNPTKAIEFKSYLYSVLKAEHTPDSVKNLINKLVHFEEGVKRDGGKYTQYASKERTYTEIVDGFKVSDTRFVDELNRVDNRIRLKYDEDAMDEIQDYIYRKLEGVDVPKHLDQKYGKDADIQEFIDVTKKSYTERGEALTQRGLLEEGGRPDYAPLVLDLNKIHDFLRKMFPNDISGAKQFIARYLVNGIMNSPKHYTEMLKKYQKTILDPIDENSQAFKDGFKEWLEKQSLKAAEGYIDQSRSLSPTARMMRKSSSENYDDFAGGFAFLKERMPWNTGYIETADNFKFSINDLRVDAIEAHNKYRARSTGVLSDYDTFGKSFDEVEEMFFDEGSKLAKSTDYTPNAESDFYRNARMLHKRAYGMSVTETQEAFGLLDAGSQILRSLAFSSFGSYMALNSIMELSRALRATTFGAMLKLVPFAGKTFERWTRNGFTKDDLASIRGYLIGQTMKPLIGWKQATFQGTQKYANATGSEGFNKFIGKVVGVTDYIADHSPAGLLLRGINTRIDDVFETYGIKEIIQRANDPTVAANKGFMSEASLKELGIAQTEFDSMLAAIKNYITIDAKGNAKILKPLEEFASDHPEELYTFRRLMKHVRESTMQRRNMDDMFMYERSSKNSLLALAMQFKAFSIQSYRKRFVRSIHQARNGEAEAVAQQYMISAGLAGMITLGTTYIKGLGLSDEDKENYYKRALGISDFSELSDPSKLGRFLFSITANRMSEFAGITMGLNLMGLGTGTKTTASTGGLRDEEDSWFINRSDIGRNITDMFPAIRIMQSLHSAGAASANAAFSAMGMDTSYAEDREQGIMLMQAYSGTPNLPVISNIVKDYIKEQHGM